MLHKQVDGQELIAAEPETHGATFILIVLSSDKTTVSVGIGITKYYSLYIFLGNVHNNVRRSYHNAVLILTFLAISKSRLYNVGIHLNSLITGS